MSSKNNVNPGQYKVAGRERPDDLARELNKPGRAEGKAQKRNAPAGKPARRVKSR